MRGSGVQILSAAPLSVVYCCYYTTTGGLLEAGSDSTDKLYDVIVRYIREATRQKRGRRWEEIRLERFLKNPLAQRRLCDIQPKDLAKWRDKRLTEVSPSSVLRELTILSGVFTRARKEWGLIDKNPVSDILKNCPSHRRVTIGCGLMKLMHYLRYLEQI